MRDLHQGQSKICPNGGEERTELLSTLIALTVLPLEDGCIESRVSELDEVGTLGNKELLAGGENWLPERPEPKVFCLKVVEREGSWPVGLARLI